MEQNNNIETAINETAIEAAPEVPTAKEDIVWATTLGEIEEWQIARKSLEHWLDEAEQGTFGQFFESKNQRSAPFSFQNLAIVCHTSSGYIGDKVKKAREVAMKVSLEANRAYNDKLAIVSTILDCLAPNLAEERAKRAAEIKAKRAAVEEAIAHIKEIWEQFDIPATADNIRKLAPKTLAKENGSIVLFYLAHDVLPIDEADSLAAELNLDSGNLYASEV